MTQHIFKEQIALAADICADILISDKRLKAPATFKRKLRIKTGVNLGACWGGVGRCKKGVRYPRISISRMYETSLGLTEYKSFRDDPEIGSVHCESELESARQRSALFAIVAHEICHAADHWNGESSGGHGGSWKRLYRHVRCELGLIKSNDYNLQW